MSSTELFADDSFRVWRTIPYKIAKLQDPKTLRDALKEQGYRIIPEEVGGLMLAQITKPKPYQVSQVELVRIKAGELLKKRSSYQELCAEARRLGLRHCATHVGPMLRIEYADQPTEEYLRMAMEPIEIDGHLYIFGIDCDLQGPFLSCNLIKPNTVYDLDFEFVFLLPND